MKQCKKIGIFLLLITQLMTFSAWSMTPIDTSLAPMLKKVLPAIVNIRAKIHVTDPSALNEMRKRHEQNKNRGPFSDKMLSIASGVIVNAEKGYIITNAHVISETSVITVTLSDGRHFTAKIIGQDRPSDLALLQIPAKHLHSIKLSNSNDLQVGDFVAAIGSPFNLKQTVTSGIVSALGRTTLGIENYENFIQTDAPINPGNSGGALINMKGELVGINTAILAPDRGSIGIGFAIPSNMAKSVMLQLIKFGNVKRGILGIGAQDITPELADAFGLTVKKGAAITQVLPGSPAADAGLKPGDVITSVDGNKIKSASDVVNTIGFLRVDSQAILSVSRNNKQMTLKVSLSDANTRKKALEKKDPFLFGVGMKNLQLTSPIHGNIKGVMILGVEQESNAWNADLRTGDVIVSANQQPVTNITELRTQVSKANSKLLLNILRGPSAVFLVINKQS